MEGCGRAFRGLTRSAPSKSRALRKFPEGNFRRPLVGSLRACSSAKMAAPKGNMAARTGFLLAALHSVAERVNPRKARPPAPHWPRMLASAAGPHLPLLGEESRASEGLSQNQNARVLRSIPLRGTCRDGSQVGTKPRIVAAEACGAVCGQTGTGPLSVVRLPTADSLCDRMERGEEEASTGRRDASHRDHFGRRAGP